VKKRKKKSRKEVRRRPPPQDQLEGLPEGQVEALELGQPGCSIQSGKTTYYLSSAVPGDQVRFQPIRRKEAPYPARLVKVIEASEDRIIAPCSVLQTCGGCSIQAMAYKAQLEAKNEALVRALEGLCQPKVVEAVTGLSEPFGYRTKLLMAAAPEGTRQPGKPAFALGFYSRASTDLVHAGGCPVQHPLSLATLAMVKQVLAAFPITASQPRSSRGWLHGIGVRVDPQSGRSEVTLVGRNRKIPGGAAVVEKLAALPMVEGVHLSVNPQRSSYLMGESYEYLAGARRMTFHIGKEAFHLSPGSFFQTSSEGARLLADQVMAALPERMTQLADLYGGVGVFARLSRDRWKQAVVVESNPHAAADLRSWIRHSEQTGLKVLQGKVEDCMDKVLASKPDAVLLDPPRSGCHRRVIKALANSLPPVIVYVACGIEALVRDGRALKKAGYRVDRVTSVDMFPHTTYLEVVARFVLR